MPKRADDDTPRRIGGGIGSTGVDGTEGWIGGGVADDVKARHSLLTTLSHFDLENKNGLFVHQFIQAAQRLCCTMDENFAKLFFDRFGTDGVLDYKMMVNEMYA